MQSGITASQELISAFNTLVSTPTQRGLLATITNEQLTPGTTIPLSSWPSDLDALSPHLTPTAASYILLKTSPTDPNSYICITYVPDSAPVRQKMLFASTRLTLVRELGLERFKETVFVTTAEELTPAGWARHEKHTALSAPLTEEERANAQLREAEAAESGGTGVRKGHYTAGEGGSKLALKRGEGVVDALEGLKGAGAGRVVIVKIDTGTETLVLDSTSEDVQPSGLSGMISGSDPRFTFFSIAAGQAEAKIVFIYTCPETSKIKERMIYASSRARVVSLAEQEVGLQIAKRLEGSDPAEFTAEVLGKEFEVQKEESKGFARPKRPGRR